MKEDLLDDFSQETEELPGMLNVLTILTFIWSGIMVLISIYNLFTIEKQQADFEKSMELMENTDNPFGGMFEGLMESARLAVENAPLLNSVSLLVAILCILGAIWMRKLKRNGYFLYVAACLLEIILPIIIIGGGIMTGMLLAGSVFSILFIILYGVNLKHLKS